MSSFVSISDEQAKAAGDIAAFGTEGVKAVSQAGSWLAKIVQDVPQDLIGVLGGDWLHHVRQRNLATLQVGTAAHLERVEAERRTEPSPSVLVPLLAAAANESREELQSLWTALLANAMVDKGRRVRVEFFNVVRQMEPLDALVLRLVANPGSWQHHPHAATRHEFSGLRERIQAYVEKFYGFDPDATQISLEALERLACIVMMTSGGIPSMTAFGRGLLVACEPPV